MHDCRPMHVESSFLDVYGEHDIKPAIEGARSRARALADIPGSEQLMIAGADHHYTGKERELAEAIHRFLAKTVKEGLISKKK